MSSVLGRFRRPIERRLKLRLAGEDPAALAQRRDRRKLRWLWRDSDDRVLRFRALRHLSELIDPESVPLFTSVVTAEPGEHPPAVVRTAAEGLGRLLNGDCAPVLRDLLIDERPTCVQLAAARGLGMIGRPEDWAAVRAWCARVDGALLPSERDCPDVSVREPAGTAPLVQVLAALYADKSDVWWSKKASRWLTSGDPVPRMKSDRGADRIVAQRLRDALQRRAMPDAEYRRSMLHLGSLARDRDQELLAGMAAQPGPERRHVALVALGLNGDPRSIPLLDERLRNTPADQPELAADLARAAGRLGWPDLSKPLQSLQQRFDSPEVHAEVRWSLNEI
jgi:HEAT repeat protein